MAGLCLPAQDVSVRISGDQLQISARDFHFLAGKPLERMRNGSAVPFDIQVSLLTDNRQTVLRRSFERFVISYDLWEEKYSVTRMRSERSSASHLSAAAAEAWCVERFSLETAGLPNDKPIWVRLDVRAQEAREALPLEADGGLSLATLIELFSRTGKSLGAQHWRAESKPVRLADLRRRASL
jgi:hypothetical protein